MCLGVRVNVCVCRCVRVDLCLRWFVCVLSWVYVCVGGHMCVRLFCVDVFVWDLVCVWGGFVCRCDCACV
jgi:hypothetical protein